jgi:hypothetical protein
MYIAKGARGAFRVPGSVTYRYWPLYCSSRVRGNLHARFLGGWARATAPGYPTDAGPKPSLIVIEDLDGANAGYGAFWGEVQSAIHRGLGAVGLVTNGSIRDLPQWAPGFQVLAGSVGPPHAFANLVAFDVPVTIAGMPVRTGDIVHADRHGAVVIPPTAVRDLPAAARQVAAREARILAVARAPGCTAEKLIGVFEALDAIH